MKIEMGDRFSAKKSTMIYLAMALVIVILIVVFVVLKVSKGKNRNFTNGYDTVYSLGSYAVKLNTIAYIEDTSELRFIYYCKRSSQAYGAETSEPNVSEVRVVYDDKGDKRQAFPFTAEALNDMQSQYSAKNVEIKDARAVLIFLEYKDADYYDPDKIDEFGDVKKGDYHEGEKHSFYITVDIADIPKIKSSEYIVPPLNKNEMDNAQTVATSSEVSKTAPEEQTTTTTTVSETVTTTITTEPITTTTTTTTAATQPPNTTAKQTVSSSGVATKATTKATTEVPKTTTTTTSKTTTTTTTTTTKAAGKAIKKLALNVYVVELPVGGTSKATPIYEPTDAAASFVWSSNKPEIATVDQNGNIKAVGTGKAIIKCVDKNNSKMTAACMVSVS